MTRLVKKSDFKFKTHPYAHQLEVFERSRDEEVFGLFMEQGTGKTKVILDTAAWLFDKGEINGLLVVAPNGVHQNWIDRELPVHFPDRVPRALHVWDASTSKRAERSLNRVSGAPFGILAMNVEAFSSKRGAAVARRFLTNGRRLMTVDESTAIKTPKAKRTKAVLSCRRLAPYRRILTGTPVTQGPFDLFSQIGFLDPEILGFTSYYAFRHYYAVFQAKRNWGQGRDYDELVRYVNLDELIETIAPYTYRITKDECLDLPDKLYSRRPIEMTTIQRKIYADMAEKLIVEYENEQYTAPIVLTKLLRLSQITGGFLPKNPTGDDPIGATPTGGRPIGDRNPKVEATVDVAGEIDGKMIIWTRFRPEVAAVAGALRGRFGDESVVEHHGGISSDDRQISIDRFEDLDDPARFFVGTPATGRFGFTLNAAGTVVYYSNDYSLEKRAQSEDRSHRIGQAKNVHYIDLEATGTIDEEVAESLRNKQAIADYINRDNIRRIVGREKQR